MSKAQVIRFSMIVVMFASFGIFSLASTAPVVHDPKPIVIKDPGSYQPTNEFAYVNATEVLIPLAVVQRYFDNTAKWLPDQNMITVDIKPNHLQVDSHSKNVFKDKVILSFPAIQLNNQPFLDIANLDSLLGIGIEFDYNGNLILERNSKTVGLFPVSAVAVKGIPTGKINLAWDVRASTQELSHEATVAGLNVLSPTWFAITEPSGLLSSKADKRYVEQAHNKGYKVWALITNNFDPDLTHKILSDDTAQNQVIDQLLIYASYYNFDGINLDFENIYDYDKNNLSSFVEKISTALKQQNLVVSVDLTVPANVANWSNCYDRVRLGQAVDYVMVMAYDEHWSRSPISGSVASYGWVKAGIEKTLLAVPKEKLLLGLPFYTREWEEQSNGTGNLQVRSRTLSMAGAEEKIRNNHLALQWLDDQGQYYTEYEADGKRYRIWLEEERSMALKADLVDKYQLAGVASWRKGFEKQSIWTVLNSKLHS
jgi:spore germination protein YaaH